MKRDAGWDRYGISTAAWAELALQLKAEVARRVHREDRAGDSLIDWGQQYLPHYFQQPPSVMHRWLADELDAMTQRRGTKLNVLGPRGGAKIDARHAGLRAAGRRGRLGAVHLDRLRHAAPGLPPTWRTSSSNWCETRGWRPTIPTAVGKGRVWRSSAVRLRNGVVDRGLRHRAAIPRPAPRRIGPTLIVCDDLQNDDHMRSAAAREHSRDGSTARC